MHCWVALGVMARGSFFGERHWGWCLHGCTVLNRRIPKQQTWLSRWRQVGISSGSPCFRESTIQIEWVDPVEDPAEEQVLQSWWNEEIPGIFEGQNVHKPLVLPFEKLDKTGGHIVVKARVGRKTLKLLVDSGASHSSLSSAALRTLDSKWVKPTKYIGWTQAFGAHPTKRPYVRIHALRLGSNAFGFGGVPFEMLVGEDDLAGSSGTDGILGMDFLHQHIVRVDFKRRKLGLYPPNALEQGMLEVDGFGSADFELVFGCPTVVAQFPKSDAKIRALVDLGAARSAMNPEAAALQSPVDVSYGARGEFDFLDGGTMKLIPVNAYLGLRIGTIALGPFDTTVEDESILEKDPSASGPEMLLGVPHFRDRVLIFGFPQKRIFVSQSP